MGFDEVVLCGVPLQPGPYAHGQVAPPFTNIRNIEGMRRRMEIDTWMAPYAKAMSGWPRTLFGEPA